MNALDAEQEMRRLEALRGYDILDTPPEQVFDDLTAIAARLCDTPIALISFVDEGRQWFKSRFGLDATQTPRNVAFCARALEASDGLMEVSDARLDARFADNPLVVGEPGIRFYAGTVLATPEGHALGTLCVIDREPRRLQPAQRQFLRTLGRQVVRELELRRLAHQLLEESRERARALDEERRARHALQVKTSLLEAIMDTSTAAITLVDTGGQVTYANPRAETLLELVRSRMQDRRYAPPPWKFTTPDGADWPAGQLPFQRILATGQPVHGIEHAIEWLDGRRLQLSVSGAPIRDESGAITRMVFSAVDVTERYTAEGRRRDLQTQLNHAQKMDAIGTLAGGIAHDFNNILSTILGNVVLATQDLPAPHDAVENLREIERASLRAKGLIEKLLAYSRRTPRDPRRQALQPIIEETIRMVRAILPAGVSIDLRLCETPLEVLTDSTELSQVLINLCTNAWQAMTRSGGRIVIGLAPHAAGSTDASAPGEAHLWVSDDGRGMDAATQARVFEPFFTTRSREGGTGLGLSVVHGIVAAHGGSIGIDSRPAAGTTFNLRLPLVQPTPHAATAMKASCASQADAHRAPRRLAHVLYLDDEEPMVSLMTRLLERRGYRVSGFTCANSALAAVAVAPDSFDVIVSDHNMPGATGVDVARQVAAFWPNLKVIITSGYVDERLVTAAGEVGVRHVIYKPDSIQGLGEAIDTVIRDTMEPEAAPLARRAAT